MPFGFNIDGQKLQNRPVNQTRFSGGSLLIPPPPPYIIAANNTQIINSITGLTYQQAAGPSTPSAVFKIMASGLTPAIGDITATPSTDFEVYDGTIWQSSPFMVAYTGGAINTALIYQVRLKAGLTINNYNEIVTLSGADAPNFDITINGSVTANNAFMFTVKTDNSGSSASNQFLLPLAGGLIYNANIDWGDGNITTQTTDISPIHTYNSPGTYQISISGVFPSIQFLNTGDNLKLLSINNWGNITWTLLSSAFHGCSNMIGTYADAPIISACTTLNNMFTDCALFNSSLVGWDVSNVTNLQATFQGCNTFNQDLSSWDISNVTNLIITFLSCTSFNGNIDNWNTGNVIHVSATFQGCTVFNRNISGWDVSNVIEMNSLFQSASSFNQPIGIWITTSLTSLQNTFLGATSFNQSLIGWDVSNVTSMLNLFLGATVFNGDITNWVTGNVANMQSVFNNCPAFNKDISLWDTSNVTNMSLMFFGATIFNQNISGWNTVNVINMSTMFARCVAFNADISGWIVTNVTNMGTMFFQTGAFNQPLNSWDMSNVQIISFMFEQAAAFNQPLDAWDVGNVTIADGFMIGRNDTQYSAANLDGIYNGWSILATLQPNVAISFGTIKYTLVGATGKAILVGAPNNWVIIDGGI